MNMISSLLAKFRARRDYLTTFAAEAALVVSYLLTFRLVAMNLGATGFGEYSLSRRTLSMLLPLVVVGLDIGVARYVAYADANNAGDASTYPPAALAMLAATVTVLTVVLVAFATFWSGLFFGSPNFAGLVYVLPILVAGGGLNVVAYGYLRGLARIQWANVVYVLNFAVVPIAAILLFRNSVEWLLAAMGVGWFVVSAIALSRSPLDFSDLPKKIRVLARFGIVRVPGDFVSLLLFAMPSILIAHSADIRVAGIVAFGIAALGFVGTALTPVSFVLLPFASRMFATGSVQRLRTEMIEVVGFTMAGALLVIVLAELFARQIVRAYLGPDFLQGVDLLRLTLVAALPWAVYVTLRSVIDARHVRPVNARNMLIAFASFIVLAALLPRVSDTVTSAVLAFVVAIWILAGLTILEVSRIEGIVGKFEKSPLGLIRIAALGALPVAILVSSPQRTVLSAVVAAAYVVVALLSWRWNRANQIMLAYVGVVALWMAISFLRTKYLLHLTPDQLSYGQSKFVYFVFIVLPMSAAVAFMINKPEDAWPVGAGQMAFGIVISLVTVALLGDKFLGADRYSWQGNLIALGTVVAIQPWLIRNLWISAAVGVLGVFGIFFASARQSLAAFGVVLLCSAVYWAWSRYLKSSPSTRARLRKALVGGYVLLPIGLFLLTGAAIAATYNPNNLCRCVTDRIISIETSPGDRDKLLRHGVELLFQSPIVGTGLGSFAGSIQDTENVGSVYQYPHNVPLEIAAETGLIGFVLIMVPLLVAWLRLIWGGIQRGSPAIAGIVMLVGIFFIVANISGDIPSDRGMWVFGILAFKLGIDAWQTQTVEQPSRLPQGRMDAASPAS